MDNDSLEASVPKDALVVFQTSQGVDVKGTVLRMDRHVVVFEFYNPGVVLRTSEAIAGFKIQIDNRVLYSGGAVVVNLMNTGMLLVCEAALEEGWQDVDAALGTAGWTGLKEGYGQFIEQWQRMYRVAPEFKLVVADMQMLLMNLRHWLEQVELTIRSQPAGNRIDAERQAAQELHEPALKTLAHIFERFETVAARIEDADKPACAAYVKKQLHGLVLCSPFMYRTFQKPLGYAGDYEMVNMMSRDPYEGGSLFAKVLNCYFLNTAPVVAHRNRLEWLAEKLVTEACRLERTQQPLKAFNLGCGPALEVQKFLARNALSGRAEFTLLDFNEETLVHAEAALQQAKSKHQRATSFNLMRKAVTQFIKEASKPASAFLRAGYNFVYCAGLFDYLPKHICQLLSKLFYQMLAPGGAMVLTNVDHRNPNRHWMQYAVDWHLTYRNHQAMKELLPAGIQDQDLSIQSEASGVNILVEVRKPPHA